MFRDTHTFSQGDLFYNFDLNKIKFKEGCGTAREMKKKYKYESKPVFVAKIFWTFIKLVFKDMAENGITFHLPTKNIAIFSWKSIKGDDFTKAYQSGKFDDIDFLSSNFALYLPIFKYFYRGKFKERNIIFSADLRSIINEKVNKGFKYC